MIILNPGLGIIKHKFEKKKDAVSLAISITIKKYKTTKISVLETKYDYNAGEWYIALEQANKKIIIILNSMDGKLLEVNEI